MHHFRPPAPKSCIANQQLNSLTACQYLPCGSVATQDKKEGIEVLHIGGYAIRVRVPTFSTFIYRRYGPPSWDSRVSYVGISFCMLQKPAFPCCLQPSEAVCLALPLAKAGLFLKGIISDHGPSLLVCHGGLEHNSYEKQLSNQGIWYSREYLAWRNGGSEKTLSLFTTTRKETVARWGSICSPK